MSDRTDELTAQVQEQTGVRYTHELLAIKKRRQWARGGGQLSAEDQYQAAALACLNRAERRRLRRGRGG